MILCPNHAVRTHCPFPHSCLLLDCLHANIIETVCSLVQTVHALRRKETVKNTFFSKYAFICNKIYLYWLMVLKGCYLIDTSHFIHILMFLYIVCSVKNKLIFIPQLCKIFPLLEFL